ncbi:tyrosine-protein phosphatase [Streptomyces roseirectus]|uniref:Tyrosine-protein phosphatase n=1 Tax=Streptomyces roseirectus TaxID=2768066 RepID=A0A7H0IE70_9ACTN|nr:tyrosine-protein phosphatase [Streptomyces roseirectus]QNP71086.1 tyrosine-protein phosphatase [Streptomyces roseirectus]
MLIWNVESEAVGVNFREVRAQGLRGGRLFRCGHVTSCTEQDAAVLRDRYGIRTVVDLRSAREVAAYGPPQALLDAGLRWVQAPLTGYSGAAVAAPRPTSADVVRYYHGILTDAYDACWPGLFDALASACAEPFLICCHFGKDRTGLAVASLLDLLGCPPDDIALDYAESARDLVAQVDRFQDKWLRRGHTRDDYLHRVQVRAETMRTLLSEVRDRHGGLQPFLSRRGVSPTALATLRTELSVPEV